MLNSFDELDLARRTQIDELCREYEDAWYNETVPSVASFVGRVAPEDIDDCLRELLATDFELRLAEELDIPIEEFLAQFPSHSELIDRVYREVLEESSTIIPRKTNSLIGTQIGDYQLLRELGRGGMGIVYEALQVSLQRHVALKILPPSASHDPARVTRFAREARAVARLHHERIVEVYGAGEANGTHFIAMQFIAGESLDRVLAKSDLRREFCESTFGSASDVHLSHNDSTVLTAKCRTKKGTADFQSVAAPRTADFQSVARCEVDRSDGLEVRRTVGRTTEVNFALELGATHQERHRNVARIGQQMAEALSYAHSQGVLHRDVKPSNILLDDRGSAWLTDFGLAKVAETNTALTESGNVIGTIKYLAPESLSGKTDERSDIYSLGLTLYELLSGRAAFDSTDRAELLNLILTKEATELSKLVPTAPRDLVTIIHKSIEREAAQRYQTANELADDLQRFLNDEPIRARPISNLERFVRWARRNKLLSFLLLTTFALLTATSIGSLIAMLHFQKLEGEQRNLTVEKTKLADTNSDLAQKNALLADEAATERDRLSLFASDTMTQNGLRAADDGRHGEALLWFAHAGMKCQSIDSERLVQNVLRYDRLKKQMARPLAVLPSPDTYSQVFLHPKHRYLLVSPNLDKSCRLWDISTAPPVSLTDSVLLAHRLAWTPDGEWLAVGGDGQVTLLPFPECVEVAGDPSREHRRRENAQPRLIQGPPGHVKRLCFDSTGRFLAIATEKVARVWDLVEEGYVAPPLPVDAAIVGLAIHPNRQWLVTLCANNQFHAFALGASAQTPSREAKAVVSGTHIHNSGWSFKDVKFIGESPRLLTQPNGNSVRVWNLETQQPEKEDQLPSALTYAIEPLGHGEFVACGAQGRVFFSAEVPNQIRILFDPHDRKQNCMTAAYDPIHDHLFVGFYDRDHELWSAQGRRLLSCSPAKSEGSLCSSFSADGRLLAAMQVGGKITVWEMPTDHTGQLKSATDSAPQTANNSDHGSESHTPQHRESNRDFSVTFDDSVHRAAFSQDSRYLAVTSEQNSGIVVDLSTRQTVGTIPTPPRSEFEQVVKPLFLPSSDEVAVEKWQTADLRRLEIWNWRTGQRRQVLEWPAVTSDIYAALSRQSDDKRFLLVPTKDDAQKEGVVAVLLDLQQSGELIPQHITGPTVSRWLAISPNGKWLSGTKFNNDKNFYVGCLYHNDSDTSHVNLSHWLNIESVRFSSDSTRVVTCSWDRDATVWNSKTGKKIAGPFQHAAPVASAEFSDDNRYLLTLTRDVTASVWNLETGELACVPLKRADETEGCFRPGQNDQVLLVDRDGWLQVWDWRHSNRLWPASRLCWGSEDLWRRQRTFCVSPDGHYIAVGGSHGVHVIDLTPLDRLDSPPSLSDWLPEAELLSGHRLLENGVVVDLTSEELQAHIKSARQRRTSTEAPDRQAPKTISANVASLPQADRPQAAVATEHRRRAIELLEKRLADDPRDNATARQLAEVLFETHASRWHVLRPTVMHSQFGATLTLRNDGSIFASGKDESGDSYSLTATSPLDRVTALRLEVIPDASLPSGGSGRHSSGNFQLETIQLFRQSGTDEPQPIRLTSALASYQYAAPNIDILGTIRDRPNNEEKVWHVWGRTSSPHHALFAPAEPIPLPSQPSLVIKLMHFKINESSVNLGRFRLSLTDTENALERDRVRLAIANHNLSALEALIATYRALGKPEKAARLTQP